MAKGVRRITPRFLYRQGLKHFAVRCDSGNDRGAKEIVQVGFKKNEGDEGLRSVCRAKFAVRGSRFRFRR